MNIAIAITDDLATCLALRRIVFIDEQGVPEAEEVDALEDDSIHLMAKDGDVPVGTARVYINNDIAKIGRVCVLQSARGQGIGAALILKAIEVAQGRATQAKLGAQVQAIGFYEALGFKAVGPIYDDAGIDHRDMIRAL